MAADQSSPDRMNARSLNMEIARNHAQSDATRHMEFARSCPSIDLDQEVAALAEPTPRYGFSRGSGGSASPSSPRATGAPAAGTSSFAAQRMAFTISRRNDSPRQTSWKWPSV